MEAKIYNYTIWITETSPSILKPHFDTLLKKSGFVILNYIEHHFQPQGFTALWLLAESHLAIHTFPEQNKAYVELSSCNEEMYIYFKENIGL